MDSPCALFDACFDESQHVVAALVVLGDVAVNDVVSDQGQPLAGRPDATEVIGVRSQPSKLFNALQDKALRSEKGDWQSLPKRRGIHAARRQQGYFDPLQC